MEAWESPPFQQHVWENVQSISYAFDYANSEFIWIVGAISEVGECILDGLVAPRSLASTRSITAALPEQALGDES